MCSPEREDRSLISNLVRDTSNFAVVPAVVRLAHSLGLKVVAEGVEDPEEDTKVLKVCPLEAHTGAMKRAVKILDPWRVY
ncbi:MAG: EAL domain-containing protein [Rubrobacter sp.]